MISIAMATYNGARYIKEQLNSILKQSISDFELVVCDDCSTDETISIVNDYIKVDKRIRIYQNEKNLGYKKNFERVISLCKGEFIALCDQDDIWTSNHLEILYARIGEKSVSVGNAEIIDKDGRKIGKLQSEYALLDYVPEDDLKKLYRLMFFQDPFPGCNMLIRKSFADIIFPINNDKILYHDEWTAIMACLVGKGISYTAEVTLLYRFHEESVTALGKKRNLSRWRCIVRKLISNVHAKKNYVKDRIYYYDEVKSRNFALDADREKFIDQMYIYHRRRTNPFGRLINLMFDIKYYKYIYSARI